MGTAMMIGNLSPFLVALLSFIILRECTHWSELLNMILCFFCVVIVILQRHILQRQGEVQQSTHDLILGVVYSFLGAVLFSFTYVFYRYIRDIHYSVVTSLNTGVGLLLYIIVYLIQNMWAGSFNTLSLSSVGLFYAVCSGVTGVLCSLMFAAAS